MVKFSRGGGKILVFCKFIKILMVSDKAIHKTFQIHKNLKINKTHYRLLFYKFLPKLYFGFNNVCSTVFGFEETHEEWCIKCQKWKYTQVVINAMWIGIEGLCIINTIKPCLKHHSSNNNTFVILFLKTRMYPHSCCIKTIKILYPFQTVNCQQVDARYFPAQINIVKIAP